jgi:hypothetical protein
LYLSSLCIFNHWVSIRKHPFVLPVLSVVEVCSFSCRRMNSIKTATVFITACIVVLLISGSSQSLGLSDSLHLQVWTGAQAIYQEPVGLKGNASGIAEAKIKHTFSRRIYAELALDFSSTNPQFFLENASIGFKNDGFKIQGGMMSERIGRAIYYKPFSIYNKFARSSIIWDSNGFGVDAQQLFTHTGIEGAITLNSRENGSAYFICSASDNKIIADQFLIGLQTGEVDYNDNCLTLGNDLKIDFNKPLALHCAVKYCRYQGFGTPPAKPGYDFELLNETKSTILKGFTLSTMVYYKEFQKNYDVSIFQCGINGEYMVYRWIGVYAGYEYQTSMDAVLNIPEAGLSICPIQNAMTIRIGGESVRKGDASINRLSAVVWYVF